MVYNLADFNIEFKNKKYYGMPKIFNDYITDNEPDFAVTLRTGDIEYERTLAENDGFSDMWLEVTAAFRRMAEALPQREAFVLHSVLVDVEGTGVVFAAHSGTGKTTHSKLWQQLLGERLTVVNGDKPIVRFLEGEKQPFGYGTPWNGKEGMGTNGKTEIKHICFIERAKENTCEEMKKGEIIDLIMNQVYMPKDSFSMLNTMQLIQRFISSCRLWKICCNMDISAARTAYNRIFSEE